MFPDGKSENLASSEGKRVLTDGQAYEVTKVLKMNVPGRHRHRAPTTAAPRRARPAPPTRPRTPGSWATRRSLSAAVWVGYPDAGIAMPGAQGGTYAAPVWHAFMEAAHGDDCDDFPPPEHPAEFHPFFGKYAAHRQADHHDALRLAGRHDDRRTTRRHRHRPELRPALLRAGAAEPAERPGAARAPAAHRGQRAGRAAATARGPASSTPGRGRARADRAIQAALTDRGDRTVRWTGDDAAVVRAPAVRGHLDRHGRRRRALLARDPRPGDVGWKALATALSDIAAMGAEPGEAYVSLVLPADFDGALELVGAMEELAGRAARRSPAATW